MYNISNILMHRYVMSAANVKVLSSKKIRKDRLHVHKQSHLFFSYHTALLTYANKDHITIK